MDELSLPAVTIPARILATYDPAVRDRLVAAGRMHQNILHISVAAHARMVSQTSESRMPGITLRPEFAQAAILTICEACDRYQDGKCLKCRICGGHRRVDDWVRLSSHHCPEGKW